MLFWQTPLQTACSHQQWRLQKKKTSKTHQPFQPPAESPGLSQPLQRLIDQRTQIHSFPLRVILNRWESLLTPFEMEPYKRRPKTTCKRLWDLKDKSN